MLGVKKIVLVMQRRFVAQHLQEKMRPMSDLDVVVCDYPQAEEVLAGLGGGTAVIEVAESGRYGLDYCMGLCRHLQAVAPKVVRVLMVSEQDGDHVEVAICGKKEGLVHDFLFYDNSMEYVVMKITSYPQENV